VHLFKLVVHNLVIFIELHYLLKVAYKTGLTHYSECKVFFIFYLFYQNKKLNILHCLCTYTCPSRFTRLILLHLKIKNINDKHV